MAIQFIISSADSKKCSHAIDILSELQYNVAILRQGDRPRVNGKTLVTLVATPDMRGRGLQVRRVDKRRAAALRGKVPEWAGDTIIAVAPAAGFDRLDRPVQRIIREQTRTQLTSALAAIA